MSVVKYIAFICIAFSMAACESRSEKYDIDIIQGIISSVKYGWKTGDETPFREHFLDYEGGRYIETGEQNTGLTDLIETHLKVEHELVEYLVLEFLDVDVTIDGDFAWAVVDTRLKVRIRQSGQMIDRKGYQTFLFKQISGTWKVIHTHSSSRTETDISLFRLDKPDA